MTIKEIFLDQYGILADFNSGFSDLVGNHSPDDTNKFNSFIDLRGFEVLPLLPGAMQLVEYCLSLNVPVSILSSSVSNDFHSRIVPQKIRWLHFHRISLPAVIVPGKHLKQNYSGRNKVLVDDDKSNIEQWVSNNGIGIHAVYNPLQALDALKQLMSARVPKTVATVSLSSFELEVRNILFGKWVIPIVNGVAGPPASGKSIVDVKKNAAWFYQDSLYKRQVSKHSNLNIQLRMPYWKHKELTEKLSELEKAKKENDIMLESIDAMTSQPNVNENKLEEYKEKVMTSLELAKVKTSIDALEYILKEIPLDDGHRFYNPRNS